MMERVTNGFVLGITGKSTTKDNISKLLKELGYEDYSVSQLNTLGVKVHRLVQKRSKLRNLHKINELENQDFTLPFIRPRTDFNLPETHNNANSVPSQDDLCASTTTSSVCDGTVPISNEHTLCNGEPVPERVESIPRTDNIYVNEKKSTCEETKSQNLLDYECTKKQKHLQKLSALLKLHMSEIKNNNIKSRHYSIQNVDRRETRYKSQLKFYRVEIRKLQKRVWRMNVTKQNQLKILFEKEEQIKILEEEKCCLLHEQKRKKQRRKSFHKNKAAIKKKKSVEDRNKIKELNKYIIYLESRLKIEDADIAKQKPMTCLKTKQGFGEDMRLCVMDLLALEVACDKAGRVIQSISKHIYHISLSLKDLPSRQAAVNISDESQFLTKVYFNELLRKSKSYGVNKDGTQRKKIKILDTALTLDDGHVLPLGYKRSARETASDIAKNTKQQIEELVQVEEISCQDTNLEEKKENTADFKIMILEKLAYFMSDRAANEKASDRELVSWVKDEMQLTNSLETEIYSLHCMAHVLLGFASYAIEFMKVLQAEIVCESGNLGRDVLPMFLRYGKTVAPQRVILHTSDLLGLNVDEKNGIRDKWLSVCETSHIKSLVSDYKDNRFNGLFRNAAEIMHHLELMQSMKGWLSSPNLKVQSWLADIADKRLVTMVQALAIVYVKITAPYWRLVINKDTKYFELYKYIQPFYARVNQWIENPEGLLDPHDFSSFKVDPDENITFEKQQNVLIASAITIKYPEHKDFLLRVLKTLMCAFKKVTLNQMSDFLEDGKFGGKPSSEAMRRTAGSGATNLTSERHFGTLDASQKRRRHATLHYHSSIHILKSNRIGLLKWFKGKSNIERSRLNKLAKMQGRWLRNKHRKEESTQRKMEADNLKNEKEKMNKRVAMALVRKAKKLTLLHSSKKSSNRNQWKSKNQKQLVKKTQKKRQREKNNIDFSNVTKNLSENMWVAVAFENGWYIGMISVISQKDAKRFFRIKFMVSSDIGDGVFRWPSKENYENVSEEFIFKSLHSAPNPIGTGRTYRLPLDVWKEVDRIYMTYKMQFF